MLHKRLEYEMRDWLRFAPKSRRVLSWLINKTTHDRPLSGPEQIERIHKLCRAARICPNPKLLQKLEARIDRHTSELDLENLEWDAISGESDSPEIRKGIILKAPVSENEKGVILISFEGQWLRLFRYGNLEKLAKDYHLVLASSWSPPQDLRFTLADRLWPGQYFHQMSNLDDTEAFARIAPKGVPVQLLASSWVHPKVFDVSEPVEKEFDMVMLANFAEYKRHFLLFKAMKGMKKKRRVLLLGKKMQGRTKETILNEAAAYGVADRIVIREGLPDGEMIRSLRSGKISLIFSGNEGSCVAVVEAMFADVPVAIFEDAIIGSKAYINEDTGVLLNTRDMSQQLENAIDRHEHFSPRNRVMQDKLSCFGSTERLNEVLRDTTTKWGDQWTRDIAVHYWRPDPTFVSEDDIEATDHAYLEFESKYGISLTRRSVDGRIVTHEPDLV